MKHLTKRLLALTLSVAMAATMAPVATVQAAGKKTVTVSTQAELTKALATKGVSKITVKTAKAVKFTVKKGTYSAKLEMNAPKATMTNSGKWASVTVVDAKSFTERAKNNKVVVKDKKLTFTVAKGATVKSVTFAKKGASETVKINGTVSAMTISSPATVKITDNGSLKKVTVDAKAAVTLSGSSDVKAAVTLTKNAKDSSVKSAVPVAVKASADAAITLKEGAEGSTVAVKTADAKVSMTNSTKDTVEVTKADGTRESVAAGEKSDILNGNSEKEDVKKDEEKKPEAGSGLSGDASPSGNPSSGDAGNMSGIAFARAIAAASYDASVSYGNGTGAYMVSLDKNVVGDVDVTFDKNEEDKNQVLIINLNNHTVSGSFRIVAPTASGIYLKDAGLGANGAVVTGDLEVTAPMAHVENQATVNGTTKIHEVSDNTYCMFDKSAKFEVYGSGKIQFAQNVTNPPKIDIKTNKQVILDGAIEKIEVQAANAKIQVTTGTAISEVAIPAGYDKAVLSGEGKIETVNASAPVEVKTEVANVVVNSDAAEITVSDGANISNLAVASGVKEVTVSGNVSSIDVSEAGNDIVINATDTNAKIVVKDEAQAKEIQENPANESIADLVVYVTGYEVTCELKDDKIYLATGDKIDLGWFKLKVTYSDESEKELAVSQSMLKNPDYILSPAGAVSIKIVYAGIERVLADNIFYLDQDDVTLTCSVGQKEIKVNGDGFYFDTYTIGAEYFENNGLASIIKGTSSHGCPVTFQYNLLEEKGDPWKTGLPEEAGNYVIRATTDGGEDYIDGEAYIWIIAALDKDYFEFDQTKISAEILEKVDIFQNTDYNPTDNTLVHLGSIYFKDDSFSKDVLQSILNCAVSTHNKAQISYKYFAGGATFLNSLYDGLPEIPGGYCIELYGKDSMGNQSRARIYVNCNNAKFATVSATVTGAGITVADGEWPYENHNSTITASDGTVSITLKNGCMNQFDVIEIPHGIDYEMDVCADSNAVSISDCKIIVVEEFVYSGNGWSEKGTEYKGEGLPKESGRYRIVIPVKENPTTGFAETWSSFVINIGS
ncbi:MAG: hypothetical protein SPG09_09510 [Lachnospiraceae bacterium]|nr:hypothetical protein [bacterium]MDY5517830.1 hypothetical protein [Lachnospiraceae bacterium]